MCVCVCVCVCVHLHGATKMCDYEYELFLCLTQYCEVP